MNVIGMLLQSLRYVQKTKKMICLENNNNTNNNEDIATHLFSTLKKIPSHIKDVRHKNGGYEKVSMY